MDTGSHLAYSALFLIDSNGVVQAHISEKFDEGLKRKKKLLLLRLRTCLKLTFPSTLLLT